MKIQDQVCSLGQAKKLKELGVISENSLFTWFEVSNGEDEGDFEKEGVEWHPVLTIFHKGMAGDIAITPLDDEWTTSDGEFCSHKEPSAAFTVAELGIMLPNGRELLIEGKGGAQIISGRVTNGNFWCSLPSQATDMDLLFMTERNEAEARASMLIHLLEAGKITPEEVNSRLTS